MPPDESRPFHLSDRWITDVRGRRVSMIDPMRMQMLHQHDVIDRKTLDQMMEALEPGLSRNLRMTLITVILGVSALGLLVVLMWFLNPGRRAGLMKALSHNPGMWIGIIAAVVIPVFAARKKHRPRLPTLLLRHRRCPHCGYDLSGLPADTRDDATVCPECACAWRLGDETAVLPAIDPTNEPSTALKGGLIVASLLGMAAFVGILFVRQAGGMNWMAVGLMVGGIAVVVGVSLLIMTLVRRSK